jgi:pyruvate/2-oxoglutarate dehydrogenase complex dihydrolipoamide acyltransferase (E2) component
MRQFLVPDLGIGNKDAKIVAWHVAEGDHIVVDGPLVSLETEKVAVEISSPWSGHIARLLANAGDQVKVGAPIVEFADATQETAPINRLSVTAHRLSPAATSTSPTASTRQFLLPDLGIGDKDAAVVAWHVREGDHVVANQQLVSIETDKATVELPSPWSGRITRLLAKTGEQVKVGAPMVTLTLQPDDGQAYREPMPRKPTGVKREPPKPIETLAKPATAAQVKAAPVVPAPARHTGAEFDSGSSAPFTRSSIARVASREPETDPPPGKAKKWSTGSNPLVLAAELVVIFLCGLFLVWWIAAMGQ